MTITVLRHSLCDDLGSLGPLLKKTGQGFRYVDAFCDDISALDPLDPAPVILTGSPAGVYQKDDFPFIGDEIAFLEKRLAQDLPTLGICFGGQLIAKALGADVYPGAVGGEIGWFPISVNEAGKKTPLKYLDKEYTCMMHWHGDTFDLPAGATLLASSDRYENQAFSWGDNILALQFHPEVTARILAGWFVGAAADVYSGKIDLRQLQTDTAAHIDALVEQMEKFMTAWLERAA